MAEGERDGSHSPEKAKKGGRGPAKLMKDQEERTDIVQKKRKDLQVSSRGTC